MKQKKTDPLTKRLATEFIEQRLGYTATRKRSQQMVQLLHIFDQLQTMNDNDNYKLEITIKKEETPC